MRARAAFLKALAEKGVVRYACECSGIDRRNAYHQREVDPTFAAEWDRAYDESTERLEQEAIRRATGYDVVEYDKNGVEHTTTQHSDRLLEFMLASRDDKYRVRRVEMTGKDGGAIHVVDDAESVRGKLVGSAALSSTAIERARSENSEVQR